MKKSLSQILAALNSLDGLKQYLPDDSIPGRIKNLKKVRRLFTVAGEVPGLEDVVAAGARLPIWHGNDISNNSPAAIAEIKSVTASLTYRLTVLRSFLIAAQVKPAGEGQVTVTLPGEDLAGVSEALQLFRRSVESLILDPAIGGTTRIRYFENGSLVFVLEAGEAGVGLLSSLVWAGAIVCRKQREAREVERHVSGLELKNDSLRDVRDAQKALIRRFIEAEARHVNQERFGGHDHPERLERIKNGIQVLADLIGRGARIDPSASAPEEVRNHFPNYEELHAFESRGLQITEKSAA